MVMVGTTKAREVVLIVEDETLLRLIAVDLLEDAGFETIEAINGQDALRLFASLSRVDVLLTDINMPGEPDGLTLAMLLSERHFRLRIVVTSGRVRPHAHDLPPRTAFVAKPYTAADLVAALSAA